MADLQAAGSTSLHLSYRPIDEETITKGFSCGEQEIDRFFVQDALAEHKLGTIKTTCAYLPGIASPVGFFALASVCEETTQLPGKYHNLGSPRVFPCLQMVFLAVHTRNQGKGVGSSMGGAVISLFAELGPKIGLPHLILVPINDEVVPYYEEKLGFTCYRNRSRMFLPLQSALDAIQCPDEQ